MGKLNGEFLDGSRNDGSRNGNSDSFRDIDVVVAGNVGRLVKRSISVISRYFFFSFILFYVLFQAFVLSFNFYGLFQGLINIC